MAKKVRKNVNRAMNLLNDYQQDKFDKVQRKEDLIDKYESRLGEYLVQLTKREMNTAQTRQVSLYLHTINDFERIGDHAADISEITIMLSKEPYVLNLDDIKKMASETVIMLIRSIEAYVEKDMNKAQEVIRHDDIVDDLFDKNKADIIELIRHDPEKGEQAADMLMVAKYFERIGDHATNIAEWVIFALNDKKK